MTMMMQERLIFSRFKLMSRSREKFKTKMRPKDRIRKLEACRRSKKLEKRLKRKSILASSTNTVLFAIWSNLYARNTVKPVTTALRLLTTIALGLETVLERELEDHFTFSCLIRRFN